MGIWFVEPATAEDSPHHELRIRNRFTAIPPVLKTQMGDLLSPQPLRMLMP